VNAGILLSPRRYVRLLAADAMNVGRDPVLAVAVVLSLVPIAIFAAFRDAIDAAALDAFGVVGLMRYVAAPALVLPAALLGWVAGYLLLEDRDEGTLTAVAVTPAGKTGYFAYRVSVAAFLTAVIVLAAMPVVAPLAGLATGIAIALMVGVEAAIIAALLPTIARNKVEGLALSKVMNLAILAPLVAIVVSPWRYAAGIVPSYWIGEMLEVSGAAYLAPPAVLATAAAAHAAVLAWAVRRYTRVGG
jgi:fluoroquinolone transport system permease protein